MSTAPEADDDNGADCADCLTLTVNTHSADVLEWLEKICTPGHFCQFVNEDGTLVPNIECRPAASEPFVLTDLTVSVGTLNYMTFGRYVLCLESKANRVLVYKQEGASFRYTEETRPESFHIKARVDEDFEYILKETLLGGYLRQFQSRDRVFFGDPNLDFGTPISLPALLVPRSVGHTIKSAVKV
jgi:hypothetical protein